MDKIYYQIICLVGILVILITPSILDYRDTQKCFDGCHSNKESIPDNWKDREDHWCYDTCVGGIAQPYDTIWFSERFIFMFFGINIWCLVIYNIYLYKEER